MLATTKLAIGAISTTGVIGGAVGINYALNSKSNPKPEKSTLKQLIINAKRTPLKQADATWDIKYSTYNKSLKESNPLSLSPDDKEGLKSWCQEKLDEEIEVSKKDSSDYQIALKLCTKPTNSEKLTHNAKTLVADDQWSTKSDAYKSKGEGANAIATIEDKSKVKPEEISAWCKETLQKEIEDKEDAYNLFEKWCSKEVNP